MSEIVSSQLHRMATAPQALDNQFFPDHALAMLYDDDPYQEVFAAANTLRSASVRREWHRAILYSPETILNRAYAVNEPAIIESVNKYPEEVARLFKGGRLVLLLLNNSKRKSGPTRPEVDLQDFLSDPPFDLNEAGVKAWSEYISAGYPVRYLRLSRDEDEAITDRFPGTLRQMTLMSLTESRRILRGLRGQYTPTNEMSPGSTIDFGEDADRFRQFFDADVRDWIKAVQKKAEDQGQNGALAVSRGAIYKRFVLPEDVPTNTTVIDPSKLYSMEMKLLADLVYNHNVPATIGRYSFIPSGLPDPRCMPPALRGAARAVGAAQDVGNKLLTELIAATRERAEEFVYTVQEEMLIPDWERLSMADVGALQSCPEWKEMIETHDAVLDFSEPEDFRRRAAAFGDTLYWFQKKVQTELEAKGTRWRAITKEALKIIVRPIIVYAGQELGAEAARAMIAGGEIRTADLAIDLLVDYRSKKRTADYARDRRLSISNTLASITVTRETEQAIDALATLKDKGLSKEDLNKMTK